MKPKQQPAAKKAKPAPLKRQTALLAAMTPEKKVHDTPLSFQVATPTSFTPVCLVSLGALNNERTGNQIRISGLNWKCLLTNTTNAPTALTTFRIIVLHDKAVNGIAPQFSDVYSVESGFPPNLTSFRNYNQLTRFDVLHDDHIDMNLDTAGQSQRMFKYSKSGLNIPILYNDIVVGTPPTDANLKTNGIFVMVVGTGDLTRASGNFRIKYFDS